MLQAASRGSTLAPLGSVGAPGALPTKFLSAWRMAARTVRPPLYASCGFVPARHSPSVATGLVAAGSSSEARSWDARKGCSGGRGARGCQAAQHGSRDLLFSAARPGNGSASLEASTLVVGAVPFHTFPHRSAPSATACAAACCHRVAFV